MTDIATRPSVDELFQKWKQFLDAGQFTTATGVAAGHPDLIDPLQRRINDYLSARAADLDATLTAEPEPREPSGRSHIPAEYTVVRHLGHGGMGDVWQVRDELNREFALKVARADRLSEAGQARIMDEMRAMARLDHPHVARIHHYGRQDGIPYFLMPVYPASLKDRLAEYQADPAAAARLMAAVAEGVGHLHAAGLVHRDLKPGNVLLDASGRPAVSDLGLVKTIGDDSSANGPVAPGSGGSETRPSGAKRSRTVAGTVLGTRSYMCPEQAAGLTHLANPRWDVWALGVILHQLLTGELPPSSEAPERLLNPNEPDNPVPSEVKPGIDPRLERIARKCLARREEERYADAREVAEELHALFPPVRPRGRRKWAAVAAIALVCGLAAIAIGAFRGGKAKTDEERHERLQREFVVKFQNYEQVTLIDEAGRCPYDWRVLGARTGTTPVDTSEGFSITTLDELLLELVPAGLVNGPFELSGEAKYVRQGDGASRIEVYFSHALIGPGNHTFAALGYREFGGAAPADQRPQIQVGAYGLWVAHCVDAEQPGIADGGFPTSFYRLFEKPLPGGKDPYPWRTLVVRVTPDAVVASFDTEPPGSVSHLEMDLHWKQRAVRLPRPPFGPDGGIGIHVCNATAMFRNVSIRRLD